MRGNLDKFFGGKPGAAASARAKMHETYGPKDGEHVFQSVIAKAKRRNGSKRRRRGF
jgi:hypothetical protein